MPSFLARMNLILAKNILRTEKEFDSKSNLQLRLPIEYASCWLRDRVVSMRSLFDHLSNRPIVIAGTSLAFFFFFGVRFQAYCSSYVSVHFEISGFLSKIHISLF